MSFNSQRKEEINWITSETMKLYQQGQGSMSECLRKATKNWKEKGKEQVVLNRVFREVR